MLCVIKTRIRLYCGLFRLSLQQKSSKIFFKILEPCDVRCGRVFPGLARRKLHRIGRLFWTFVVHYAFFEGAPALHLGRNTNLLLGLSSWNGFIIAVKLNNIIIFLTVSSQANWSVLKHYTRCVIVLQFFQAFFGSPWTQLASGSSRMAANFYGLAGWQRTLADWLWIFSLTFCRC